MNAIAGFFVGIVQAAQIIIVKLIGIALLVALFVAIVWWCKNNPQNFRNMTDSVGDALASGIEWVGAWLERKTDSDPAT